MKHPTKAAWLKIAIVGAAFVAFLSIPSVVSEICVQKFLYNPARQFKSWEGKVVIQYVRGNPLYRFWPLTSKKQKSLSESAVTRVEKIGATSIIFEILAKHASRPQMFSGVTDYMISRINKDVSNSAELLLLLDLARNKRQLFSMVDYRNLLKSDEPYVWRVVLITVPPDKLRSLKPQVYEILTCDEQSASVKEMILAKIVKHSQEEEWFGMRYQLLSSLASEPGEVGDLARQIKEALGPLRHEETE